MVGQCCVYYATPKYAMLLDNELRVGQVTKANVRPRQHRSLMQCEPVFVY
jgi:hypothetical protein